MIRQNQDKNYFVTTTSCHGKITITYNIFDLVSCGRVIDIKSIIVEQL